jgi:hypothetical protein
MRSKDIRSGDRPPRDKAGPAISGKNGTIGFSAGLDFAS